MTHRLIQLLSRTKLNDKTATIDFLRSEDYEEFKKAIGEVPAQPVEPPSFQLARNLWLTDLLLNTRGLGPEERTEFIRELRERRARRAGEPAVVAALDAMIALYGET